MPTPTTERGGERARFPASTAVKYWATSCLVALDHPFVPSLRVSSSCPFPVPFLSFSCPLVFFLSFSCPFSCPFPVLFLSFSCPFHVRFLSSSFSRPFPLPVLFVSFVLVCTKPPFTPTTLCTKPRFTPATAHTTPPFTRNQGLHTNRRLHHTTVYTKPRSAPPTIACNTPHFTSTTVHIKPRFLPITML